MNSKTSKWFFRFLFYILGAVILSLGITLNTKTGMGTSPIISIAYTASVIWNINFGKLTFIFYVFLIALQFAVRWRHPHWIDLLQILVSLVVSYVLDLFNNIIPMATTLPMQLLALLGAIVGTGVGAAMMLNSRLVANPGDGIVQAISDVSGKNKGFVKNMTDLTCAVISLVLGFVMERKLIGVGIGTIVTILGVGRVIWLYDKLFKAKTDKLSGMENVVVE